MSVPDWVDRNEREALEALANATMLTVMIGQGPQPDGHVPPVRYTGFSLGDPDFEAARAFLRDALRFKRRSKRFTAEVLERCRERSSAKPLPRRSKPPTPKD